MPVQTTPKTPRGRLLRRVRKFLGLSQREMARDMSCDKATLSQWETGAMPLPDQRLDTLIVMLMDADVVAETAREGAPDTERLLESTDIAKAIRKERTL
jgi:transcriptional regulator with XRE-family HTH domain